VSRFILPLGQKQETDPVASRRGQIELQPTGEETVGYLKEDPRSVSCLHVTADGPAVLQVAESLNCLSDNFVGFSAIDLGDKSYAAGIVFVPGIVQ
jgi:hypothetical protein